MLFFGKTIGIAVFAKLKKMVSNKSEQPKGVHMFKNNNMERSFDNYWKVQKIAQDRNRIRHEMFLEGVSQDKLAVFDQQTQIILRQAKERFPHPFFNKEKKKREVKNGIII